MSRATAAVVVEVQLRIDGDKVWSWPVYIATLRARLRCPVLLLVLAPDPLVQHWARRPIDLGHPGLVLDPIVVGYDDIPRIVDAEVARASPELATLSAIAHPELDVARTAVDAIRDLDEDRSRLYLDLVYEALPEILLEALMRGYEYQSSFARKYVAQGREEGREEGRRQELQRLALELATAKLGRIDEPERARLQAIADLERLHELVVALGRAVDAGEARAALDQVSS